MSLTQRSLDSSKREQTTASPSDTKSISKQESFRRQSAMPNSPTLQRTSTSVSGSSLVGLMASKRLAKRLTSKFFSGRSSGMSSSRLSMPIQKEPTYRMEPIKRVQIEKIIPIIQKVLEDRLGGHSYNPQLCNTMCQLLSEEIKERVKRLQFDRYKLVTYVLIGELKDQGMQVASRCVWDEEHDDYATCNFQNKNLFCTVTVYGAYHE